MTQLPNVITLLRIAGSLGLLLSDVTEVMFWIIYDSLADICFVAITEMQSTLCANNCREW